MTGTTTSGAGSSCGVCSIIFETVGEFRLHAKSQEQYVYKTYLFLLFNTPMGQYLLSMAVLPSYDKK